jgi:hypothetical protein
MEVYEMAVYNVPSDMFNKRAENSEKKADSEYVRYIKAKENSDKIKMQIHYKKWHEWNEASIGEKRKAQKYEGKTWKDLQNGSGSMAKKESS